MSLSAFRFIYGRISRQDSYWRKSGQCSSGAVDFTSSVPRNLYRSLEAFVAICGRGSTRTPIGENPAIATAYTLHVLRHGVSTRGSQHSGHVGRRVNVAIPIERNSVSAINDDDVYLQIDFFRIFHTTSVGIYVSLGAFEQSQSIMRRMCFSWHNNTQELVIAGSPR